MNVNAKVHPLVPLDREAEMSGLGATALWNGPWDSTGYPKGKGSSSGKDGIKLRFDQPTCNSEPITQRAKRR